jgi:hypothetical protein
MFYITKKLFNKFADSIPSYTADFSAELGKWNIHVPRPIYIACLTYNIFFRYKTPEAAVKTVIAVIAQCKVIISFYNIV